MKYKCELRGSSKWRGPRQMPALPTLNGGPVYRPRRHANDEISCDIYTFPSTHDIERAYSIRTRESYGLVIFNR